MKRLIGIPLKVIAFIFVGLLAFVVGLNWR